MSNPPFEKVLVANRGEIAVRIIRTLQKMGIASVAVASEADRNSMHVSMADEAVIIGPAAVSESYLKQKAVLDAMKSTGAQAVHPGYGLLSENATFLSAVESEGLAFIGPRTEHLEDFGLKDRARELAAGAGVPLVPGTDPIEDPDLAASEAQRIGYPVMLKAAAGGGGIGMMRCEDETSLLEGFRSVRDLAINNFGNGSVFLEKCIDRARHVEVQVFGDGKGQVVTLGARDCSLQRRNQKVLEETPAPDLPEGVLPAMEKAAHDLCRDHAYRSAGTVEFIFDCDTASFYFLEVNTRLQVEHTVTEAIYGMDLVEWMIRLAAGDRSFWPKELPVAKGHAIQARIYAEDPMRQFQPSTGEVSHFQFGGNPRIDSWVIPGTTVTPYYDPLLAKVIVWGNDREEALFKMRRSLEQATIGGVQTNTQWLAGVISSDAFSKQIPTTKFIDQHSCPTPSVEVLKAGVQITVQDHPGRKGMWNVGVPPNGPMDDYSFRLGNRILENPEDAAGLECLIIGPTLLFHVDSVISVCGAKAKVEVDGVEQSMHAPISITAGSQLSVGKVEGAGARIYVLFKGGLKTPPYLGSRSTFTLGKYGGHAGRPLLVGDTLPLLPDVAKKVKAVEVHPPVIEPSWQLRVLVGPHTAPEFFTDDDMQELLQAVWKVHFNSDRTGVRLVGPQPKWAREDGGEAGLHPSNIHDNAYCIGAMDFTGDQPVLLGPDGPSLGGFVCPFTIVRADLWKMGQLASDDEVRFVPITQADARALEMEREKIIALPQVENPAPTAIELSSPILHVEETEPRLVIRQSGDAAILCEFGALELDLALRIHVHFFMEAMQEFTNIEFTECVPGIRSMQLQFNILKQDRQKLIERVVEKHRKVIEQPPGAFRSRIIHLPLSWDDPSTRVAIEKYVTSVRPDAPWCCPSNIEFIRRVNGLESEAEVKRIVYDASYLVMGLGDVYLGAPVAVPLDPRHRLVTTKYNPARTWTPENAVGIGGAYLCIYGMEGPGGYQFVGRTLPMWNRHGRSDTFRKPYLLRFFDQIRFYEVSPEELLEQREAFLADRYQVRIEETTFDVGEYQSFLSSIQSESESFKSRQTAAFEAEKQRWREQGLFSFDSDAAQKAGGGDDLPPGALPITSPVSGAVWKSLVEAGAEVEEDQTLLILESMKMEMPVQAPSAGRIEKLFVEPGQTVESGQCLGYILP